jgi:hypothetical protein
MGDKSRRDKSAPYENDAHDFQDIAPIAVHPENDKYV